MSALERADRYLRELVASSPQGSFVLPSLSRLARECGVARMTMYKAVARLKAEGILISSPGRGIIAAAAVPRIEAEVAGGAGDTESSSVVSFPWQSVKRAISAHILDGTYPRGSELPSRKELLRRYGVCPATLRRALRALEQEGRLEVWRRGYRVPQPVCSVSGASTLLYVSFTDDVRRLPLLTPFTRDVLRALERMCRLHQLRLQVTSFDNVIAGGEGRGGSLHESTVLGAVVSSIAPFRNRFQRAVATFVEWGIPVAIIDEGGAVQADIVAMSSKPLCKVFALGTGPEAGRRVGQYLVNLGHQRVAYMSVGGESEETSPRLTGLRQIWSEAGLGAEGVRIWDAGPVEEDMSESPEFRLFDDNVARAAERYATAMRGVRVRPDVSLFVWSFGVEHWGARRARDMFRRALEAGGVSAWVCTNDTLALMALEYLQEQGVAVPQQLSVLGFDDTIEAFERGLTSYNFGAELIVQAALDHVIAPRRRHRGEPLIVELPGMVMPRVTTGPVPKK